MSWREHQYELMIYYRTPWELLLCNSCSCSAVRKEKRHFVSSYIFSVPIADNVNSSLEKYFSSKLLTSENEWFCPSCNSCIESINNTLIIQSSFILMKHLKRFCVERDKVIKDNQFFKCYPADLLQIRITDNNEFSYLNNYSLGSTINHSGSLNNGYY